MHASAEGGTVTTLDHLSWRTSSYSGAGENCVEVAPTGDGVLMRDTKDHTRGSVIRLDLDQWAAFLRNATRTRARCPTDSVSITTRALLVEYDGTVVMTNWHIDCRNTDVALHFTPGEWSAFLAGVHNAEFDFQQRQLSGVE